MQTDYRPFQPLISPSQYSKNMNTDYNPIFNEFIKYKHQIEKTGKFPTQIQTDTLLLKPLLHFDHISKSELFEIYKENAGTDRYFATSNGLPNTYQEFIETLETYQELADDGTDVFYAIYTNDDKKEFLGQGTIEDIIWEGKRCSIGIWLKQDAWGQGISQRRAEALMYTIFDDLDFELVEIAVVPENEKSIRAVEKYIYPLGGSKDGLRRRATPTPTGEIHDVQYYSITADELFSQE